jgi:hypothetical protein
MGLVEAIRRIRLPTTCWSYDSMAHSFEETW